jgi:hypothetical protein
MPYFELIISNRFSVNGASAWSSIIPLSMNLAYMYKNPIDPKFLLLAAAFKL